MQICSKHISRTTGYVKLLMFGWMPLDIQEIPSPRENTKKNLQSNEFSKLCAKGELDIFHRKKKIDEKAISQKHQN